jgi:hypothetical protein
MAATESAAITVVWRIQGCDRVSSVSPTSSPRRLGSLHTRVAASRAYRIQRGRYSPANNAMEASSRSSPSSTCRAGVGAWRDITPHLIRLPPDRPAGLSPIELWHRSDRRTRHNTLRASIVVEGARDTLPVLPGETARANESETRRLSDHLTRMTDPQGRPLDHRPRDPTIRWSHRTAFRLPPSPPLPVRPRS